MFLKKCNCLSGSPSGARPKPVKLNPRSGVSYTFCPNCSYRIRVSAGHKAGDDGDNKGMEEGDLPKGLPSDLLLSNSPAAQLLLSDKNIVQYANKAAIELLSFAVNHKSSAERLSEFDEGNEIEDPQMQSLSEAPVRRKTTGSRTPRTMGRVKKSTGHGADANNKNPYPPDAKVTSLVGLALTELPMDLAEEETRRWITLEGVLDNIKLSLKKASERAAQDLDDKLGWRKKEDEFYEKFYGNEEASFDWNTHFETGPTPSRKNLRIDTQYLDDILELSEKDTQGTNTMIAKQSIPIKVFRISGRTVTANLYVSVISPGGGGGATLDKAYTSLSLLPMDASFSAQNSDAGKKSGGRTPPSEAAGLTGEAAKVVERVHKLKDLILDEMDYYFMCLSPDGDILITNKATKKLLLGPLAQQVGEGMEWVAKLDIYRSDFSEKLPFEEWALNTILKTGKPVSQLIGMYTLPPNSRKLILQLRGKALWENAEKEEGLLAALAVVIDQTEWATREERFKRGSERKSGFLKAVGWKLRKPIAGIVGLLEELYQNSVLGDEQKDSIKNIFRAINTLLVDINDLMDFSQVETQKGVVELNTFSVLSLMDDLQRLFSASLNRPNVQFSAEIDLKLPGQEVEKQSEASSLVDSDKTDETVVGKGDKDTTAEAQELTDNDSASKAPDESSQKPLKDLVLVGDDGKLRRILINMLTNAFQFTLDGGVILRVKHKGKTIDGRHVLRFEVEDTGMGMPEDLMEHLFVSFEDAISRGVNSAGPGLGMIVSKNHADALGAQIGCNSVLDHGSKFYLELELEPAPPDTQVAPQQAQLSLTRSMGVVLRPIDFDRTGTEVLAEAKRKRIEGKNVLLVEDNWAHQLVIEKRLKKMGCKSKTAANGHIALEVLQGGVFVPDLIVMDLQMPILNGFQTTIKIRKDAELSKFKNIPIVAITSAETTEDRAKAKEAGMDGFYLKPLSAEILRELLEKFLWTPPTATPGLDNLTTDDGSTGETSGQTRISKAPKAPSVTKAAHGVRSPSDRSIKAPSVAASAIAALPGTMAAPELTFTAATDTNTPAESEREV